MNKQQLANKIWASANKMRSKIDANEYKDYIRYNAQKPISDYDLIFQNIIVQDGNWTVIDYEWTYPESIDPEEIIKRAFWCYLQGNPAR